MQPRPVVGLLFALWLTGCAEGAGPQGSGVQVRQGRYGETIVTAAPQQPASSAVIKALSSGPSYEVEGAPTAPAVLGRLSSAGRGLPKDLPVQFRWDGDVLVHRPTGVRLPKTHDGCTLAAIAPPRTGGYERGGSAEYDCRPATDLTYVSVTFEGGAPALGRENLQMAVARVAAGLTMQDASIPGSPCVVMDLKTEPGHVNRDLAAAQCGVRWRKRGSEAMFGTATYVLGRGLNYVALTNTCSGPACAPNRPKFGHFIDTFDETAMGGDIAPSS